MIALLLLLAYMVSYSLVHRADHRVRLGRLVFNTGIGTVLTRITKVPVQPLLLLLRIYSCRRW